MAVPFLQWTWIHHGSRVLPAGGWLVTDAVVSWWRLVFRWSRSLPLLVVDLLPTCLCHTSCGRYTAARFARGSQLNMSAVPSLQLLYHGPAVSASSGGHAAIGGYSWVVGTVGMPLCSQDTLPDSS